MADVKLGGRTLRFDPDKAIGKGGEADVYDIGGGLVFKLFKSPDHPDFEGEPTAQAAARRRIAEHQHKLLDFPTGLPAKVVAPQELGRDSRGRIVGYSMPFLSGGEVLLHYSQPSFRKAVPTADVVTIFRDLHGTVSGTHAAKVVIGDNNDLNVLVRGLESWLIDADSMQFGKYACTVFTTRFVDPLLCDPNGKSPMLVLRHNENSDWYAFNVMLMQSLLMVDPYGGVYKPADKAKLVPHPRRPLKRITVFHPEVKYPKAAVPFGVLPDDLLQHFHAVFEKDARGIFPIALLDNMRWTKCLGCGAEHARSACPNCATVAPAAVKQTVTVRGQVTATRMFRTVGTIVRAEMQGGKVLWLYNENGAFHREDGNVVAHGDIDPRMRFRLQGESTLLGKDGLVVKIKPDGSTERFDADVTDNVPVFDTNDRHVYWASGGKLMRDGAFAPERIGDVLAARTHFWMGPKFGFGFYRAGLVNVSFVFDADSRGINDGVKLGPIRGKLIDASCVFTKDRCWFFTSAQEGADIVLHCSVIKADGSVEATATAKSGDDSWLTHVRGGTAAANFLLVPTDEGVVRVEPSNGQIVVTKSFPDTEPFVDAGSRLLAAADGLYVIGRQEVVKLAIK